jgi:hypothetical protein
MNLNLVKREEAMSPSAPGEGNIVRQAGGLAQVWP